jgi:putative transposase
MMCRVMAVSHSGFYEWLGRAASQRSQDDARLTRLIRESFELSDRTYGSPRVWHDLRAMGENCGLNRVARLMSQAKLQARRKRRRLPSDNVSRLESHIAPNHLQRDFQAEGPNQKWTSDFTYIWTAEGWLYAAAVMDLCSRRIVGWSMSDTMQAKMVSDALLMALWRRGKPSALMHHSDQGSQYTSDEFQQLLKAQGITCSMSRRGECWDNAAMESFFSSLKTERTSRKVYRTREEARSDVFDYIERFYNPVRKHSKPRGTAQLCHIFEAGAVGSGYCSREAWQAIQLVATSWRSSESVEATPGRSMTGAQRRYRPHACAGVPSPRVRKYRPHACTEPRPHACAYMSLCFESVFESRLLKIEAVDKCPAPTRGMWPCEPGAARCTWTSGPVAAQRAALARLDPGKDTNCSA